MLRWHTATAVFGACETGVSRYCTPDTTFEAEARALEDIANLEHYTNWMHDLYDRVPDGRYEVRGFAEDAARDVILAFGVISGTVGSGAEARDYKTNYVYAINFDGDKIGHVTKIWNDTF